MYTIRQILGTTLGLTMSGVKQKESAEKSLPSLQSQIVALGKSAKDSIDFTVKRSELLRAASTDELNKLQKLAQAGKAGKGEYNRLLLDDIQKVLDSKKTSQAAVAPQAPAQVAAAAGVDASTNKPLATSQEGDNTKIVQKNENARKTVQEVARDETEKLKKIVDEMARKYENRLNFNDAIAILQANWSQFKDINENDVYLKGEDKANALTKKLDTYGYKTKETYVSGENNYATRELQALYELIQDLKADKTKALLEGGIQYAKTKRVAEFSSDSVASMVDILSDLNGDGFLEAKNSRDYSNNIIFAALQRLTGMADVVQGDIEGELSLRSFFQKNIGDNKEKLISILTERTGKTPQQVQEAMKSKDSFVKLAKEFQRAQLITAAMSGRHTAGSMDAATETRARVEAAKETAENIKAVKKRLEAEGMVGKIEAAFSKNGINLDGKTIDEIMNRTATRLYAWNPQFFASLGAHVDVTNTTTKIKEIVDTVDIVQYPDGEEVSRTTTRTENNREENDTKKKIVPTLVVGFHQDIFGYETEKVAAHVGAGLSAVASPKGVMFPLSLSADADLTLANSNKMLQTADLSGNFVLGGRVTLSKDLSGKSKGVIPSFGVDINPNDVKNAIDKQNIRLANLMNRIKVDGKGDIDAVEVGKSLVEQEKSLPPDATKDTKQEASLRSEIAIMRRFLTDLQTVVNNSKQSPEVKKVLVAQSIEAFKQEYASALLGANRGFHLAGVNLSFVPGISGIFLGLNVQNVVQKAYETGTDSKAIRDLNTKKVSAESLGLKVTADNGIDVKDSNIKRIIYTDGLIAPTDGIIRPTAGHKLVVNSDVGTLDRGVTTKVIVIGQEKIQIPKSGTVTSSDNAPSIEPASDLKSVYNRAQVKDLLTKANSTEEKLYALSRGNKDFVAAMNLVREGNYDGAIAKFESNKALKPFAVMAKNGDKKDILNQLLLATSGSRNSRGLESLTSDKYKKIYDREKSAFARLISGGDASVTSELDSLSKTISAKIDKNTSFIPASRALSGAKDISGMVAFSQIGGDGKRTVAGLKDFHGDIRIVSATAEITGDALKDKLIASAERSGALQKNMESTNTYIASTGKQFDLPKYKEFLKSGVLPPGFEGISIASKPQFVMARCALDGAVCLNDTPMMGYPKLSIGTKLPETTPPMSQAPEVTQSEGGNQLSNAGGVGEGTVGLNISRVVNEVVQNVVTETIVTNVTTIARPTPPVVENPPGSDPGIGGPIIQPPPQDNE